MFWSIEVSSRESAWRLLVEALALGADAAEVQRLAKQWGCTDEDAVEFGKRVMCMLNKDGDQWVANRLDFVNLQESKAGFGTTCLEAMAELAKALGLKPNKSGYGHTFKTLLHV